MRRKERCQALEDNIKEEKITIKDTYNEYKFNPKTVSFHIVICDEDNEVVDYSRRMRLELFDDKDFFDIRTIEFVLESLFRVTADKTITKILKSVKEKLKIG